MLLTVLSPAAPFPSARERRGQKSMALGEVVRGWSPYVDRSLVLNRWVWCRFSCWEWLIWLWDVIGLIWHRGRLDWGEPVRGSCCSAGWGVDCVCALVSWRRESEGRARPRLPHLLFDGGTSGCLAEGWTTVERWLQMWVRVLYSWFLIQVSISFHSCRRWSSRDPRRIKTLHHAVKLLF